MQGRLAEPQGNTNTNESASSNAGSMRLNMVYIDENPNVFVTQMDTITSSNTTSPPAIRSWPVSVKQFLYPLNCNMLKLSCSTAKTKESYVKSLLCFQCFYGKCAVGFLHICMCYIGARPTRIVVKNPSFYFKIYLDGWS